MPRKPTRNIPQIRELTQKEMPQIYPLICQLNPGLPRPAFLRYLKEMQPLGYRCVGAFSGKKLVAVMGIWTFTRFWCGRFIEIDNIVVDQRQRSGGTGKLLFAWAEEEAKRLGCNLVMADSYTHNYSSHRFYLRERCDILGFCFVRKLKEPTVWHKQHKKWM